MSGWDRFMPWRTIEGKEIAPRGSVELEVLLKGVFDKRRFFDLVLNFVVFDDDGATIAKKKAAAYHQFHAVNKAVEYFVGLWHRSRSGNAVRPIPETRRAQPL